MTYEEFKSEYNGVLIRLATIPMTQVREDQCWDRLAELQEDYPEFYEKMQ